MLEYQSVVMEGFISQEFSSVSADSKIVMGFIKMAMNNYHAVKHRYNEDNKTAYFIICLSLL